MPENEQPELIRAVGVSGATTLNMIDMIGVGPFITMPLIIVAMGGPQAMLGWIFGALLVICDGLFGLNSARQCRRAADLIIIYRKFTTSIVWDD